MARGSITQRGDSFRVRVSLTENGQRKQVTVTAHSPQEAEKLRTKLMNQKYEGILAQSPKGNLGDYLKRWLNEYASTNLSPTTYTGYEYIIRYHITPAIGGVALKNLKPEILQNYYASKVKSGLSSTSVRHHHTLLHKALKQACRWGLISRNPADADMVTAPRNARPEMHTLTNEQIADVLRKATTDTYHCLFYLALQTGLRRGELLGLRWTDINLDFAELSVMRSAVQCPGGEIIFKTPKTKRSSRPVALSPQTCIVLRRYLDNRMAVRSRLDKNAKWPKDALVFSQLNGDPLKGNTVWKAWNTMLKRMGITGVRFHDIRHTMATLMLSAGIHPKIVQERLGHASISTTLDLYSHVAPGLQQAAAGRMDDLISANVNRDQIVTIASKIDKVESVI